MHDETTFDDLELIASSYLAHNNTITLDDRQRMVRLLRKSLEQRLLFHVPKTVAQSVAVYDFQIECQAIAERDHIQHNNDRLCLEALLICERILLFRKEELLFEPLFKRRVMMLVQNNQFDRCFHLNLNLFHLYKQMKLPTSLHRFLWVFCRMIAAQVPILAVQFSQIYHLTVKPSQKKLVHSSIKTALYMVAIAAKV
ncbi:unnamed protein product [Rotaria socialis]